MNATQPETKRTAKLSERFEDGAVILSITVTTARKTKEPKVEKDHYRVQANTAPGTLAVRLHKMVEPGEESVVYDVELSERHPVCDCRGHEAHGHCKHADALAAKLDSGSPLLLMLLGL